MLRAQVPKAERNPNNLEIELYYHIRNQKLRNHYEIAKL